MLFTEKSKKIRVMLTPFRDGLQSSFGGKVRFDVNLDNGAAAAVSRHFEAQQA